MTDIHVTTMNFEAALAELKRQEALRGAVANDARELELDELETQPTLHMPSRGFLVRQACLNMVAEKYPILTQDGKARWTLEVLSVQGTNLSGTPDIVELIRAHFRKLVAAYQ